MRKCNVIIITDKTDGLRGGITSQLVAHSLTHTCGLWLEAEYLHHRVDNREGQKETEKESRIELISSYFSDRNTIYKGFP